MKSLTGFMRTTPLRVRPRNYAGNHRCCNLAVNMRILDQGVARNNMPTITRPKTVPSFRYAVPQKDVNAKVVFMQMLPLKNLSLKSPLALTIEYTPRYAIVSNADLELFGYGDTESEAMADFARSLEEFHRSLKKNKKKLSRYLKLKFDFLNTIISEKRHVVKNS